MTGQDKREAASEKLAAYGSDHRKSVLVTSSLIVVLWFADTSNPTLFGIEVTERLLWIGLTIGHVYFFFMWSVSAPMENWRGGWLNTKGILRQMVSPLFISTATRKTKATIWLVSSLPIWAFVIALVLSIIRLFGVAGLSIHAAA